MQNKPVLDIYAIQLRNIRMWIKRDAEGLIGELGKQFPVIFVTGAVNTDTHLEDTSQAKKIPVSKSFDFSIFMSFRPSLPLPFFL